MTGPSGSGKSTILRDVMAQDLRLALSVSHTTRPARPGERDGVEYHFVGDATFDRMVAEGAFAEWAGVHAKRYGTSRAEIERLLGAGHDIVFDIDVQGAAQLRAAYPSAVAIFILPPTMASLEERLRGRATESEEQVQIRLQNARAEIARADTYDYLIVNDSVDEAVADFLAVIHAERRRGTRVRSITRRLLEEGEEA
ncbi:MAG: guanylate kinase [Deltaproteobacteria bacterium HGW-Deltaproteobacteria-14]|jgi:guanylate kinase|nr:MAG: guanylate kinase [Deltaproteobacteria bacterium HGW-Deltaproteobacteria-14]